MMITAATLLGLAWKSAIIAGLTLVTAMLHFKNGIRVAIEDYAHGTTRHLLIIAASCLSYAVIATGLLALVRLAL